MKTCASAHQLRRVSNIKDVGAHQVLKSLEDFKPEEWGIPPF